MHKFIFMALFFISLTANSEMRISPFEIYKAPSNSVDWTCSAAEYKDEKYRAYSYDNVIVFHILERFTQIVDGLIWQAQKEHGILVITDLGNGFFHNEDTIKKRFTIEPSPAYTIINPEDLQLSTEKKRRSKKYYVTFSRIDETFKVTKSVFKELKLQRVLASVQKKFLSINFRLLCQGNYGDVAIKITDKAPDNDDLLCNICLTDKKNYMIEPCNHVCLCEKCAQQKYDACPICRRNATKTSKVYL